VSPTVASRTVAVTTLGCRSNQYDSSALEDSFKKADFDIVPLNAGASAYVINTCTVTGPTDSQSRQLIRKIRRENPSSVLIVTGCYAEVAANEVASIEGVDYVLGNPEKSKVVECALKGRPEGGAVVMVGGEAGIMELRAVSFESRTRANLKLQDGCDKACTYCIIPRARGASRSVTLDAALKEFRGLADAGFGEIVLTGIHLGAYGLDLKPKSSITELVRAIDGLGLTDKCRGRISSLDPDEVTDEFIDAFAGSRVFCNHMHLSLQSGDDRILRLMRRSYTALDFSDAVLRLFKKVEGINIGADVIAGFPGEDDKAFGNTLELLKKLPVSYLHIFPYSVRKGTSAEGFKGRVSPKVTKERCEALKILDMEKRAAFNARFVGTVQEVLIETSRDKKTGFLKGRTRSYIPALIKAGDELKRKTVMLKAVKSTKDFIVCEADVFKG